MSLANRELGPEDDTLARGLAENWAVKTSIPQTQWDSFAHDRAMVDSGKYLEVPHFRVLRECFEVIAPEAGHEVLEVGAGSCYNKRILDEAALPVNYYAMDCSPAAKDFAAVQFPSVPYTIGDASDIPLRDGLYDTVISGYVLIHVYEWEKSIREAARASRRWVILHRVITHAGPGTRKVRGVVYGEECLLQFFTIADLTAAIKGAGMAMRAMIPVTGGGEFVEYSFVCEKV